MIETKFMQISQIRAFLAVTELKSFSLAANRLHITQPAVSKRIRQLEETLQTTLVDRIGKKSILTPSGVALLPHAERILLELKAYSDKLALEHDRPSGTLSLATSHHVGLHRLPQILRSFKIAYPDVDLDLHFMDSEDACTAIANNDLELAIVTLPENQDEKLYLESVWVDAMEVVLAIDHPLARMGAIVPEQLLEFPAILPSHGTFTRKIIDNYFAKNLGSMKIILETNYLETIKVMVSANLGWSMLPVSMLDDSVIGKALSSLDIKRPLGIVTRQNRTLSINSRAMIEMLRNSKPE
jgi:DNA-binding transcriptional LysR family regulator